MGPRVECCFSEPAARLRTPALLTLTDWAEPEGQPEQPVVAERDRRVHIPDRLEQLGEATQLESDLSPGTVAEAVGQEVVQQAPF